MATPQEVEQEQQTLRSEIAAAHARGDVATVDQLVSELDALTAAAAKTAPDRAPNEGTPAQTPEAPGDLAQGTSGFNEGVGMLLGAPVDAMTWLMNKGRKVVGAEPTGPLPGGREWQNKNIQNITGPYAPEDPNHAFARDMGRNLSIGLGAEAVMGPLGNLFTGAGPMGSRLLAGAAENAPGRIVQATAGAPGVVPKVEAAIGATTREAAAQGAGSAGAAVGQEHGGEWGRDIGNLVGAPDTGEALGNYLFPFLAGMAPSVATRSASAAIGTPARRAVADAAERAGVRLSPGMLSPTMTKLENWLTGAPLVGGSVARFQEDQTRQLGDYVQRQIERGMPAGTTPATTPVETAQRIMPQMLAAADRITGRIGAGYDHLESQVGTDAATSTNNLLREIQIMRRTAPAGPLAEGLDTMERQIMEMRDPRNGGVPIDPARHRQLTTLLANTRAAQQQAQQANNAQAYQAASQVVARTQAAIHDNMGIGYAKFKNARSMVGVLTRDHGLPGGQADQLYAGLSADMDETLRRRWTQELRAGRVRPTDPSYIQQRAALDAENSRALGNDKNLTGGLPNSNRAVGGEVPFFEQLAKAETSADTVAALNAATRTSPENLMAWRRGLPDTQWRNIAGDTLHRLGRPSPADAASYPSGFSPGAFAKNWAKVAGPARDILAPPGTTMRQMLDNDATPLAEALARRAKSADRAGAGASAMFGASVLAGLGAGALTGGTFHAIATAASALPLAKVATSAVTSPALARTMAGRGGAPGRAIVPSIARAAINPGMGGLFSP